MNHKLLTLLLSAALCVSLVSCGGQPTQASSAPNSSGTPVESQSGGVQVDEKLLTVDITLPASLFEDQEDFDPDSYASEQGFTKAVVNDDGSITVTMTKARHHELLDEMAKQYDGILSDMVGADSTPYIKEVTHSDDFGTITASVDRAAYEAETVNFTQFTLGMTGMIYQVFTGAEAHVEVIIKDFDTGDTIESSVFPDDMNQ